MPRAFVIVLDSLGLGATPDAERFGDTGANTLGHIAAWRVAQGRPLVLPHLSRWGLGAALQLVDAQSTLGSPPVAVTGAYGAAREISAGKDTPSGHWELMGCPVPQDWGYFPLPQHEGDATFPADLMQEWLQACGLEGSLGNCHASGTEIIDRLGDEHVRTGWPICYCSADSVFQVAAHEEHFGLERLYDICAKAKPIFDRMHIARVIARPILGADGHYRRTANRRDLTTAPPHDTLLDVLLKAGRQVHGVGKIGDIFAWRGVSQSYKGGGNADLCAHTLRLANDCADGDFVFANLVDFDSSYGHRRDVAGYADALEAFDRWLPGFERALRPGDLVAITADHGCDPTWPGSDHTREHVPLVFGGPAAPAGRRLGVCDTFADLGQTVATHLGVPALVAGRPLW